MKNIDSNIILAISSLKQVCLTNDAVGKRLGITGKHVGQILMHNVQFIRKHTWEQMEPVLRPLLRADNPSSVNENPANYCTRTDPKIIELCKWLEESATADTKAAIFAVARAGGFTDGHGSHCGETEYQSAAKAS